MDSPFDELVSEAQSRIEAKRGSLDSQLRELEVGLLRYRQAREADEARELALNHGLKLPKPAAVSAARAAQLLLELVQGLPELEQVPSSAEEAESLDGLKAPAELSATSTSQEGVKPLSDALPLVVQASEDRHLAIIGAFSGRKRRLPAPLGEVTEWIDTAEGAHKALTNLPARLKQGRFFALIICDQAISHKHSEPLVSAARSNQIAVGFAGKGGTGALARALEAIESQLGNS